MSHTITQWLAYGSGWTDPRRLQTLGANLEELLVAKDPAWRDRLVACPPPANAEGCALLLLDLFAAASTEQLKVLFPPGPALPQILSVFSASPVLGRFLIQYPDLLVSRFPVGIEDAASFGARVKSSPAARLAEDPYGTIRHLRSAEYLAILAADATGIDELDTTVRKISAVADRTAALAMEAAGLVDRGVALIAMGKWGGGELNYSSDIDLFFVAADGFSPEAMEDLESRCRKAVNLLEEYTGLGQVWRVDTQIRPEGTGPLLRPLAFYQNYYRTRAAMWELQSLVKARAAAGDAVVGAAFMAMTRPMVYRTDRESVALLTDVRGMKRRIEHQLAVRGKDTGNVKLGTGGIRDIEFITQFLQLHHGPRNENLRPGDTLTALERLTVHDILRVEERDALAASYRFLRRVEHYLQVEGLESIRQLPAPGPRLEVLARCLGLPDGDALLTAYREAVGRVRPIFQSIFDETIDFLGKKDAVLSARPDDGEAVAFHFERLPNDYFLRFSPGEIMAHMDLLKGLGAETPLRLTTEPRGADTRITLATSDAPGLFSLVCGAFSLLGLSIHHGESFTARRRPGAKPHGAMAFYRRPSQSLATEEGARHRVLTILEVTPLPGTRVDEGALTRELAELVQQVWSDRAEEAHRNLSLRALDRLKARGLAAPDFRQVRIDIDNESDGQFTLLHIEGPDAFMFLFEFTHILAQRGYSLWKIRVETLGDRVRDRLFLTTRQGLKVELGYRLEALRLTINLIRDFATYLPLAPDPELALSQFGELLEFAQDRQIGMKGPEDLAPLALILGSSASLWEDLFRRRPERLLPVLFERDHPPLLDRGALTDRLRDQLSAVPPGEEVFPVLEGFRDEEMFRIDIRHLEEKGTDFFEFSMALSDLADLVVTSAMEQILTSEPDLTGVPWCLVALGKWGGQELGYASDIEFMVVHRGNESQGYRFSRCVQTLLDRLPPPRPGIFEMDLRLRPDGDKGPLAVSLERLKGYYRMGGEAAPFERQAATRARAITGDLNLQKESMDVLLDLVYHPEPFPLDTLRHLRGRQETEIAKGGLNMKYSAGGLVDLEYTVQVLQMRAGDAMRHRHQSGVIQAAGVLRELGLLDVEATRRLTGHYRFLRNLIDALRVVKGNAKDLVLPPAESLAFRTLERRMEALRPAATGKPLGIEIRERMAESRALFDRVTRG